MLRGLFLLLANQDLRGCSAQVFLFKAPMCRDVDKYARRGRRALTEKLLCLFHRAAAEREHIRPCRILCRCSVSLFLLWGRRCVCAPFYQPSLRELVLVTEFLASLLISGTTSCSLWGFSWMRSGRFIPCFAIVITSGLVWHRAKKRYKVKFDEKIKRAVCAARFKIIFRICLRRGCG